VPDRPEDLIARIGVRATVNPNHFNVAGIIFTYQCTAACRHCLFACRPDRPHVVMPKADCVSYLRFLYRLPRVIHIAGGDCFIFYDELLDLCREAQAQGVPPHFIETNGAWCTSDDIVERRFSELSEAGVKGMFFSADPYHQEFIPAERVKRGAQIAERIFGEPNTLGAAARVDDASKFEGVASNDDALRARVRAAPPRFMVGNAYKYLAHYLDRKPIESFESARCEEQFDIDRVWEMHFDPYGNVQTNCGVVLGNAQRTSPEDILDQARVSGNPVVRTIQEAGPVGLLREAIDRGLKPRDGYGHKCELCCHARSFLRPDYPDILCPDEVYDL